MNASQRDGLLVEMSGQLGTLNERTEKMGNDITEIKEHAKKQNGDILALKIEQARLRGRIYGGVAALSCIYVVVQAAYLLLN